MLKRRLVGILLLAASALFVLGGAPRVWAQSAASTMHKPRPVHSLRLYVFDCGILHSSDMGRYNLKKEDVPTTDMSMACFLIAHPKGTMIWDTGAIPDDSWTPTGKSMTEHLTLPDGQQRDTEMTKSLRGQLAELGYAPADIKYLVLSHYHYDHTGNANEFAASTWIVPKIERDVMFGDKLFGTMQPSSYSALKNSKTIEITKDEYDVFGDGKVIIKSAPGHTQGHQVLYLKLPKTGGVVLSGDLYHYPAEKSLGRVPNFDFSPDQTRASRKMIDEFLAKTGAQLWIQHDLEGNSKLKKSPQYYE